MNKLKVLDLFAGAGGLSSGFEQTGQFKVKVAVEINKNARKSYLANHNDVIMHEDIKQIKYVNGNMQKTDEFSDIDVIIGGPPCQGFSNANRQQSTLISSNNQLVKEYLRAIEEIRPKAFVMENVKTMESEKHKFYLTDSDVAELDKLKIEPAEEHIKIGNKNSHTDKLISFLEDAVATNMDLSPYIVDKELFSKLNMLLRHAKKQTTKDLTRYLDNVKNSKFYLKIIGQPWHEKHDEFYSDIYRSDWFELRVLLKNIISKNLSDIDQFIVILDRIIETQKIISKISEIIENKVKLFNIRADENGLFVLIKSFNVFNFIKRKLASLNYVFNEKQYIFNAAQYGVPQERKRLILIGIQKEFLAADEILVPAALFSEKKDFYKILDAIGDLEKYYPHTDIEQDTIEKDINAILTDSPLNVYLNNTQENIYNHVMTDSRETAIKRFETLTQGQNFHNLDESLKTSYTDSSRTQNTIYKRLSYDLPSDTVLNVRKSMWIHPVKHRAISIREAARLQSFQDSYRFYGPKDSQYQQIGNAVPPLLARAVAESLLMSLGRSVHEGIKTVLLPEITSKEIDNKKLNQHTKILQLIKCSSGCRDYDFLCSLFCFWYLLNS